MEKITISQFREALEAHIDGEGIGSTLGEIAEICHGKAEHIKTNWQDETLAHAWTVAGLYLDVRARNAQAIRNVDPYACWPT